ncbi:hypothetical protein RJ640_020960 [Escallonia rubra]|uniref:Uncharacterized protein n=1 Tax=Escallonia rubra TaxID=112253 RepID=A0AA88UQ99_9ASTE|nr:hypothetical protein RJ640_020960 [Escallonia rubra]
MNGRTILLILFFWAALTIVTPILVRMSASAKPHLKNYGEDNEEMSAISVMGLLPRRALVAMVSPQAPTPAEEPAPAPAPTLQPIFMKQ